MLKRPTAYLPIAMSLVALSAVILQLVLHGAAPQADENSEAHIWQLMMAAQLPIILYSVIRWKALRVLAIQIAAFIAAAAPVFLLRW